MNEKQVVAVIGVIILLSTGGCVAALLTFTGGGNSPQTTPEETQLRSDILDSTQQINSYRMSETARVSARGTTVEINSKGKVNRENDRIRSEVTDPEPAETINYIDGDTAYVKSGDEWSRKDKSESERLQNQDQLKSQRELLEETKLKITGSDSVDGRDVTVVNIYSSDGTLKDDYKNTGVDESLKIKKIDQYKMFIDSETHVIRKVHVEMTIKSDSGEMRSENTILFTDFNQNTTIDIPPAARQSDEY
jgi:hypothetical protein